MFVATALEVKFGSHQTQLPFWRLQRAPRILGSSEGR
jgi:hypothetical protein